MTNIELMLKMKDLILSERKISNEILHLINLAEDRSLHLELGYSSLYDWLTKEFGYSGGAAQRRIENARQLRVVPAIEEKLQTGKLTLTTVAQARQAMRAHEKLTGGKLSAEDQADLLSHLEGKTSAETEKALFSIFPETAEVRPESKRRVSEEFTRLAMNLSEDAMADLEWVRNLLSHAIPDLEAGKIFARLLKEFRRREEKKDERAVQREMATQTVIGAEDHCVKTRVRRVSYKLSNRRCNFISPLTGKVCGTAVWIESDHIEPKALGGSDALDNRRCLCRAHNQFEAERKLGEVYRQRKRLWH